MSLSTEGGAGKMGACCCRKKKAAAATVEAVKETQTGRTQEDSHPATEETAEVTKSTSSTCLTASTLYSSESDSTPLAPGSKPRKKKKRPELMSSYENLDAIKDAQRSEDSSIKSANETFAKKGEDSARSDYCLHRQRTLRLFKDDIDVTQVPSLYKPTGKKDDGSVLIFLK